MTNFGFGFGFGARSGASAPVFDPAVMTLSLWFRDYGGSPWAGVASAGTSGSRTLANATAPSVGTAVNGHTPANCNGTDQRLLLDANLDTVITNNAWSIAGLIWIKSANAPAAQPYDDDHLLAGGGGTWGLGINTSGILAYQYNGSVTTPTAPVAFGTGAWGMAKFKRDATHIYAGKNAGAFTSAELASGDTSPAARVVDFARDENTGGKYADIIVLELLAGKAVWADSDFDNIRSYWNSRYALAL